MNKVLVTGGCGFIGSNFIKLLLNESDAYVVNVDKQTYAGKGKNIEHMGLDRNKRYKNYLADITLDSIVDRIFDIERPDIVVNFAAESHVDNSIDGPMVFTKTNVLGTHVLLEAAKKYKPNKFLQVSTDEVYGSLTSSDLPSQEVDPLDPRSPYSASKAAAEHLVRAYHETYGLPVLITRSSNNYGPYQFPEKLIPKFITNLIQKKKVPLMWSDDNPAQNVRDWLHVEDNCRAILCVLKEGIDGQVYNIAGDNERTNYDITKALLQEFNLSEDWIEKVPHRAGHDFRYSLDYAKLKILGFKHKYGNFEQGLKQTINWYKRNEDWWGSLVK